MLNFKGWLSEYGAPTPGQPMPKAGPPDVIDRVKQSILYQTSQPGTNTADIAKRELEKAGQEVAADPNAPVSRAVEIGQALDKIDKAMHPLGKKMKKKMKK